MRVVIKDVPTELAGIVTKVWENEPGDWMLMFHPDTANRFILRWAPKGFLKGPVCSIGFEWNADGDMEMNKFAVDAAFAVVKEQYRTHFAEAKSSG